MWRERQRIVSRTEPELGLGGIIQVREDGFLEVHFPRAGETRRYSSANAPLHRFLLKPGQKACLANGIVIEVTEVRVDAVTGLAEYLHKEGVVWEFDIEDRIHDQGAVEQFFAGHFTHHYTYDLRREARLIRSLGEASGIHGLVGPKVTLLPHQLYIAKEVSGRVSPRVLLADEVGLGKTIEAGLIFSALKALGRAERVLIVVPESLVHQWMAEMFRRFHQIFSVINEERCEEEWRSLDMSAFEANQHVVVSMEFLLSNPERKSEALNQKWDLVIFDEAHHIRWDPEGPEPKWLLAKEISKISDGLLLLTATPQQYGLATQFGLLNLVDPGRFSDFDIFEDEQGKHSAIAEIAKNLQTKGLTPKFRETLLSIFGKDPELSDLLLQDTPDPDQLVKALVDRHGTGRVLFRNRRSRLKGFPQRVLHAVELEPTKLVKERLKAIKNPDEMMLMDLATGRWNKRLPQLDVEENPKFLWLKDYILKHHTEKSLILCGSSQGVLTLARGLKDADIKVAVFHEELSVVERDQQAAYFADPEGADLLICSEIGGEGRNFQFARSLVFMDLPRHPDLVEQRIGRLDRIGQKHDVQIYVPWIRDTPEEVLFRWYHEGLDSFQSSWNGAAVILEEFLDEIFDGLGAFLPGHERYSKRAALLDNLVANSKDYAEAVRKQNEEAIDLLVDLNSFDEEKGHQLLEAVEDIDDDPAVEFFMRNFFDHFGVEYEDYDDRGSVLVRPDSLMFVEKIPGLHGLDECVMTFDRETVLRREDMTFLTRDHSIVESCLAMLIDRNEGVASLCKWPDSPLGSGVLAEFSIIMEVEGPKSFELGRFLPTQLYELAYNHKGKRIREKRHKQEPILLQELSKREAESLAGRFNHMLEPLIAKCQDKALRWAEDKIQTAISKAKTELGQELARMKSLALVNPLVKSDEVQAFETRLEATLKCLERAQPRIDAVRLVFTQ